MKLSSNVLATILIGFPAFAVGYITQAVINGFRTGRFVFKKQADDEATKRGFVK